MKKRIYRYIGPFSASIEDFVLYTKDQYGEWIEYENYVPSVLVDGIDSYIEVIFTEDIDPALLGVSSVYSEEK